MIAKPHCSNCGSTHIYLLMNHMASISHNTPLPNFLNSGNPKRELVCTECGKIRPLCGEAYMEIMNQMIDYCNQEYDWYLEQEDKKEGAGRC